MVRTYHPLFLFLILICVNQTFCANSIIQIMRVFDDEACSADECELQKNWTFSDKCDYIKCNVDACEGGGYFRWSEYVKCQENTGARVVIIIVAVIYLIVLFVIMSVIADDFFSPSISGIVKNLRMSESIAGVTFLAFGNGAPDVFGSISSVLTTPKPKADLAIGDLLGGGIFVTTVVLSAIILTKSFRIAIIPTVRDILFYLIALAFIFACLVKFDHVQPWMPATFLGIYGVYLATVIIWSIYRMKRKERKVKEIASDDMSITSIESKTTKNGMENLPNFDINNSNNNNNEFLKSVFNYIYLMGPRTDDKCRIEKEEYEEGDINEDDEGDDQEFVITHRTVYTSFDQASLAMSTKAYKKRIFASWFCKECLLEVYENLKSYPSFEEFKEINVFNKIFVIIKIVPIFFMNLTVPLNEKPWSKPVFIIHCYASIQFALFAIQISGVKPAPKGPGLWAYGLGVSTILAIIALVFLPLTRPLKHYKVIYSYLGFLMSIAWIYATANEIIGVITMLGIITGLSQELLGLTVLAWSNCIGDVVADIAVVKQGYPKMAMAAAIGGPMFNLLIGFGLPFTIASAQGKIIELQMTPVYRLLILFLALSLFTTLIAIFIQKFQVKWPHAVVLLIIFVLFVIFVFLAEFHVLEWK